MMVGWEEELEDLFFNCIWISDFPYLALGLLPLFQRAYFYLIENNLVMA